MKDQNDLMGKTSIIVTCHNYGRYLSWCLSSVMHQSKEAGEIIVIDDNSDDETEAVAKNLASAVRYFKCSYGNVQKARNFGLSQANGEYVLFLDADDFLDNYALELMERELEADASLKMVYSDKCVFGDVGVIESEGLSFYWPSPAFDMAALKYSNFISLPALIRKVDFRGFDERIRRMQDWDAWLGFLTNDADAKRVAQPLFYYRFHGQNKTVNENEYVERLKILVKHNLIQVVVDVATNRVNASMSLAGMIVVMHSVERLDPEALRRFLAQNGRKIKLFFLVGDKAAFRAAEVHAQLSNAGICYEQIDDNNVDGSLKVIRRKHKAALVEANLLLVTDFRAPINESLESIFGGIGTLPALFVAENCDLLSVHKLEDSGLVALNREGIRSFLYIRAYQDENRFVRSAKRWLFCQLDKHVLWRLKTN
ncbi:MAG: glycosyltransferase family 2 protein [Betaproteobacteria bacterium]|nr:glycosyltransferase family 2 protein [Betaproteobacteria bacterium]